MGFAHAPGRGSERLTLPLTMVVGFAVASPALANLVIETAILVHVQPIDPNFCYTTPFAACEDLVSATTMSGGLEFDLYFHTVPWGAEAEIDRLITTVTWPPEWQVFRADICSEGSGTIDIHGNEADLDLVWTGYAPMNGELFLSARFLAVVTGHGYFGQLDQFVGFVDSDSGELYPYQHAAEAGGPCATCVEPCAFLSEYPCRPTLDPTVIDLEVNQGQVVEQDVDVIVHGAVCPISHMTTASWLTAERTRLAFNQWRYTLGIDTTLLDPGNYEGWLRVEGDCTACTRVNLNVLSPSSVNSTTWAHVKATYR